MNVEDSKIRMIINMYSQSIKETKPKLHNAQAKGFHTLAEHYRETILIAESKVEVYTALLEGPLK